MIAKETLINILQKKEVIVSSDFIRDNETGVSEFLYNEVSSNYSKEEALKFNQGNSDFFVKYTFGYNEVTYMVFRTAAELKTPKVIGADEYKNIDCDDLEMYVELIYGTKYTQYKVL